MAEAAPRPVTSHRRRKLLDDGLVTGKIWIYDEKDAVATLTNQLSTDGSTITMRADLKGRPDILHPQMRYEFIVESGPESARTIRYVALFDSRKFDRSSTRTMKEKLGGQLDVYLWKKKREQLTLRVVWTAVVSGSVGFVAMIAALLTNTDKIAGFVHHPPAWLGFATPATAPADTHPPSDAASTPGRPPERRPDDERTAVEPAPTAPAAAARQAALPAAPPLDVAAPPAKTATSTASPASPAVERSADMLPRPPPAADTLQQQLDAYLAGQLADDARRRGWSSVALTLTAPIRASAAYGVGSCQIDGGIDAMTKDGLQHVLPSRLFDRDSSSDGLDRDALIRSACRKEVERMIALLRGL